MDRAVPDDVGGCPNGRTDHDVTVVGSVVLDGLTAIDTRQEGTGSAPSSPIDPEQLEEHEVSVR